MRRHWARFKFGVELGRDEERVVLKLDDLNEFVVGRGAGDHQTGFCQLGAISVIKLVAVAVALGDIFFTVGIPGNRSGREHDARNFAVARIDQMVEIALLGLRRHAGRFVYED